MPVLEADTPNPWKITFTAGVDADYIPSDIRVAISLLAAHWFVNREATTPLNLRTLPYGWEGIIAKYRLGGVH
jgi:uncharacterized phiE125 gp8 family phage protein